MLQRQRRRRRRRGNGILTGDLEIGHLATWMKRNLGSRDENGDERLLYITYVHRYARYTYSVASYGLRRSPFVERYAIA